MKYRYGIISCIFGVVALVAISLANYANRHTIADLSEPLISPVINKIISPLNYFDFELRSRKISGPTISRLPIFYILEEDAVTILKISALLLIMPTIYFGFQALLNNESNIWYANGLNAAILTLNSINIWMGIVISSFLIYLYRTLRKI